MAHVTFLAVYKSIMILAEIFLTAIALLKPLAVLAERFVACFTLVNT